jgi:hypothetical protein
LRGSAGLGVSTAAADAANAGITPGSAVSTGRRARAGLRIAARTTGATPGITVAARTTVAAHG